MIKSHAEADNQYIAIAVKSIMELVMEFLLELVLVRVSGDRHHLIVTVTIPRNSRRLVAECGNSNPVTE